MPQFAANLTMLFTEASFLERFALAAMAGFTGVEFLFPYAWPKEAIRQQLTRHHLTQVLFNLPPGDWDAGERGIACLPGRVEEFRSGVHQALEYAEALQCTRLNCLAGIKPDSVSEQEASRTLLYNIRYAADQLAPKGIRLMLEAINSRVDIPGFYLDNSRKIVEVLEAAQRPNLFYQYDIYHMQIMEGDLIRTLQKHLNHIGHVQFADNPGRHEPGTGEIHFDRLFEALDSMGYSGWVSAEYRPLTHTSKSLGWLK